MPKYKKSKTELSEKTSKNLRSSINNLLLERGISKTCLSATTGIELSTLSRKISGKNEFTISELIEIANFFHVSLDSLCKRDNSSTLSSLQPSSYSVKHECNNDQINKIRKVCFGLCEIFKYGDISTNEVSLHEAVFDKYPDGSYGRIQNVNNEDPINKYSYIYFSHYASLKEFDSLTPETEIKQEASDLLWNGNYLEHNVQINRFIKKLIDLRKAYKNESISYEDYVCLIDSNFSKIFEGK